MPGANRVFMPNHIGILVAGEIKNNFELNSLFASSIIHDRILW
jgi:hypothetical protein